MLLDLVEQFIGGDTTKQIGKQIGADPGTTEKAISAAIPLLLGGLTRNTASSSGAASLDRALEKDHDGSILDDLASFFGGSSGPSMGAGILKHLLGGKQERAATAVSSSSGLDIGSAGELLKLLAPIVMGALGRVKSQQGLGSGDMGGLLQSEMKSAQARPSMNTSVLSMLDMDGDGSALDDIAGALGKFFK